ncbi:glutaminyl-peptide cyclotransferase [soil metagenome]
MKKVVLLLAIGVFLVSCGGNEKTEPTVNPTPEPASNQPAELGYQLLNSYPHDTACFTEGLQYVNGQLLESAGQYGESNIRVTDIKTGNVLKQQKLDKKYFGEGCTQLNGKIYQMTYQEKTCFVYDAATLKKINEFNYSFGEGWGMTTDGTYLIISNGGSNLFYYDPNTFQEVKRVGVTNQYGPVSRINELEFIKGFVYANVWLADQILKIDTASGKVAAVFNLSDLRGKTGIPASDMTTESGPDVMNGIAYDSAANRIFITGKYWPKLFEVKFDN